MLTITDQVLRNITLIIGYNYFDGFCRILLHDIHARVSIDSHTNLKEKHIGA